MSQISKWLFLILVNLLVNVIMGQKLTAEVVGRLPNKTMSTASIYDGKDTIYIFGGRTDTGNPIQEIYQFSLVDETLTQTVSLPFPISSSGAVIDNKGENIYYFGGFFDNEAKSEIYQFNLVTKLITLVGNLSNATRLHGTIKYTYESTKVFLIGGVDTPNLIQCWDIDLHNNCDTKTMDTGFKYPGAVSYGNEAFVFGNANETSGDDPIFKLNLDTFETFVVENKLPDLQSPTTAVISGSNAYIIGGWDNFTANSIIAVNLETLTSTVLPVRNYVKNSTLFYAASAVYVEKFNRIYIIGGRTIYGNQDEILSIDLSPINVPSTTTTEISSSFPPTSTTMDPSLFTCDDKPDGFYPNPLDCAQYIGCHYNNGTIEYYTCPKPLLFNPVKRNCDSPSNVNCEITCVDKADGFYPHPQDCSYFILCEDSALDVYKCPEPLLFDPVEGICNFPEVVECSVQN